MYVGYALEGDGGRGVGVKGERDWGSIRKLQLQNQRAKSIPKQRDGDNHSSNNDSNSNT